MSRIVGVDYGTRRIGIAISDGLGLTARPLEVIPRSEVVSYLRQLAEEYEIGAAVLGLPTGLGGNEGDSAARARELGAEIGAALQIDVTYVDERFTSRMAESALLESGMKRRQRKETVDKVAAAIILQTYLDSRRRPGNPGTCPGVESPGAQ